MATRSQTEIIVSVLRAADGGASKMQIMFESFLDWATLNDYLVVLAGSDLIDCVSKSGYCYTTRKGMTLLNICDRLTTFVPANQMQSLPEPSVHV